MVTPPDIEAQILRYYHVEKWRVGTIAGQLHVHHSVVTRVLAQAGLPRIGPPARPSQIDAYLAFIRQTLATFPTLTASRLYGMVRERGYRGSADHFRHLIACHRPRPQAEAYLRLRCLPGEQAQVDWGHFGHLAIGRARRPLMAFVMVLSHARQIFLRFFPDARMASFLRGHVAAFTAWNGVPRVVLYDFVPGNKIAHDLPRHPGDERQHVDVHGNPVRQRLRPARFRKGIAGGSQHRDEDLGPAHPSSCRVHHLHGVTGEVDEHSLTCGVNLPQRRLQAANPFAIQVAEPRVTEPVLRTCPAAVFFPEQRQRDVRPPQFAVHHRPIRHRPLFRRHRGRWRKQKGLELGVVDPVGQRPTQPRPSGSRHVAVDRSLAQPQALCHGPLRQPLTQPQPQHLTYLPHRQSLTWHLVPLLLGKGPKLPMVEDCQRPATMPPLPARS